jgi:hypothetical protein
MEKKNIIQLYYPNICYILYIIYNTHHPTLGIWSPNVSNAGDAQKSPAKVQTSGTQQKKNFQIKIINQE